MSSTRSPQLKDCSTTRALTCACAIDKLPAWDAGPTGAFPKSVLPTRTPEAALSEAASWSLAADVNDSCRAWAERTLAAALQMLCRERWQTVVMMAVHRVQGSTTSKTPPYCPMVQVSGHIRQLGTVVSMLHMCQAAGVARPHHVPSTCSVHAC